MEYNLLKLQITVLYTYNLYNIVQQLYVNKKVHLNFKNKF